MRCGCGVVGVSTPVFSPRPMSETCSVYVPTSSIRGGHGRKETCNVDAKTLREPGVRANSNSWRRCRGRVRSSMTAHRRGETPCAPSSGIGSANYQVGLVETPTVKASTPIVSWLPPIDQRLRFTNRTRHQRQQLRPFCSRQSS